MNEQRNPVVASLANRAEYYSSITFSPDRRHAIAAGKDTLRVVAVSSLGLREVRSLRIAQHFQSNTSGASGSERSTSDSSRYPNVRDAFTQHAKGASTLGGMATASTVVITDVAWSLPQIENDDSSAVIAAAGSNGVVAVWNVTKAFLDPNTAAGMGQPPDQVLREHSRAVNRLVWHSTGNHPGYLLTASQDATVKLWERRAVADEQQRANTTNIRSWFGMQAQQESHETSFVSWKCLATFEPTRAEAVKDLCWSPLLDDVFAIVTDTGSLIVYNTNVTAAPWIRIQAHDGEVSTVDWHPTRPYIVATGGVVDRCVKVWDLENLMVLTKGEAVVQGANLSLRSNCSEQSDDSKTSAPEPSRGGTFPRISTLGAKAAIQSIHGSTLIGPHGRKSKSSKNLIHVLHTSASVTRVIWRPPSGLHTPTNTHGGMMAVATSPMKGASAGGNGLLSLWSYHRPYMALSIVEGHLDGAVTDFCWLDIPADESSYLKTTEQHQEDAIDSSRSTSITDQRRRDPSTPIIGGAPRRRTTGRRGSGNPAAASFALTARTRSQSDVGDDSNFSGREHDSDRSDNYTLEGTWQHVLSVGRDGRCLLQSFARGDRPISRVSPSCFAMANLSPFQSGYGSLQIFSVHQKVPNGREDDFALTGLRQDVATSRAPGVFREPLISSPTSSQQESGSLVIGRKLPVTPPDLVFHIIDQGDLNNRSKPVASRATILVAPEVVHLSRFANDYKLVPDKECLSRVSLCLHNAGVAESLECRALARMWKMLATMLAGSGMDHLHCKGTKVTNALQYALVPCVSKLLEERADAGDVQTIVAICEVLKVVDVDDAGTPVTCIPDLRLQYVREWYLSYIDLLQQMCLYSHASWLIGNCKDPLIGDLNKQSTTISESCPYCGKAQLVGDGGSNQGLRLCTSCRRQIGFCFLCHEHVRGGFVWCPGCGHGGHVACAEDWFGTQRVCPTGCGHKCSLSYQQSTIPQDR